MQIYVNIQNHRNNLQCSSLFNIMRETEWRERKYKTNKKKDRAKTLDGYDLKTAIVYN